MNHERHPPMVMVPRLASAAHLPPFQHNIHEMPNTGSSPRSLRAATQNVPSLFPRSLGSAGKQNASHESRSVWPNHRSVFPAKNVALVHRANSAAADLARPAPGPGGFRHGPSGQKKIDLAVIDHSRPRLRGDMKDAITKLETEFRRATPRQRFFPFKGDRVRCTNPELFPRGMEETIRRGVPPINSTGGLRLRVCRRPNPSGGDFREAAAAPVSCRAAAPGNCASAGSPGRVKVVSPNATKYPAPPPDDRGKSSFLGLMHLGIVRIPFVLLGPTVRRSARTKHILSSSRPWALALSYRESRVAVRISVAGCRVAPLAP